MAPPKLKMRKYCSSKIANTSTIAQLQNCKQQTICNRFWDQEINHCPTYEQIQIESGASESENLARITFKLKVDHVKVKVKTLPERDAQLAPKLVV